MAAIAASSDGACLNAGGLVPIALADNSKSLVDPINNWLGGLCSVQACSNETIKTIVKNVTQGCSSDLQPQGFNSSQVLDIISDVQWLYPLAQNIACLKE